jgi:hypothetical protein
MGVALRGAGSCLVRNYAPCTPVSLTCQQNSFLVNGTQENEATDEPETNADSNRGRWEKKESKETKGKTKRKATGLFLYFDLFPYLSLLDLSVCVYLLGIRGFILICTARRRLLKERCSVTSGE